MSGDERLPDSPRYRLGHRIATGGMGEVWQATDSVLGREVAVKLLKREYADDATFRSRFETEARNAAALHHANVASVFDFGELPGESRDGGGTGPPRPYLVMELVRGEPLSALLRGGQPMPPETAADLVGQAADGIAAAHALGIVHRDVKPANLLVTPDGIVKITDFGIARAGDAVPMTQTGQVLGTPQYLSPEQAEGKAATPASDIYSLGVVLYECLAGHRPFERDSPVVTALAHVRDEPPPLPDDVPAHLRETVRVALAKDPAARFPSAGAFATALHGGPLEAGAGTPSPPGSDAPTVVAAAAGAGVAGAGVAAAAADRSREGTGTAPGDGGASDGTRVMRPAPVGGGTPPPDDRRRRSGAPPWLPWVAAAAAVLLVVLVVAFIANRRDTGGPTTADTSGSTPSQQTTTRSRRPSPSPSPSKSSSPSPSESSSPATVTVDEGDYLGRPAKDVTKELEAKGLQVTEQPADNPGDKQKDTVAGLSPTGQVEPGSTITLQVYGDPAPVETPTTTPTDGTGPGPGPGKGPGQKKEKK